MFSLHPVLPTHALRQSPSQTSESYPSFEFPVYNLVNGTLLVTNYNMPGAATVSVDVGRPIDLKLGSTDGAPIHCAFVRTLSSSYIYCDPSTMFGALETHFLVSTLDQHLR